jgi:Family of unknown function (DUF6328)
VGCHADDLQGPSGADATDLSTVHRYVYYATLLTTAVALIFLLAPSAYHRLRFREGDKDAMVRKGNREAIAGTGAIALAFRRVCPLRARVRIGARADVSEQRRRCWPR